MQTNVSNLPSSPAPAPRTLPATQPVLKSDLQNVDLEKMTAADLKLLKTTIAAKQKVAEEKERLEKPTTPRGRGVIIQVIKTIVQNPMLKGDELVKECNKHIEPHPVTKLGTNRSVTDSSRSFIINTMRVLEEIGTDEHKAAAKAWLAKIR